MIFASLQCGIRFASGLFAYVLLGTLVGPAHAETTTRLDTIAGGGTLRVGLTEGYQPFSFAYSPVNAKRVHRVMRAHGMLLQRHAGGVDARRHDGKIAVERSNLRWCSDGFELACDNGEKVRVAVALDCCDREAMAWSQRRKA